MRNYFHHIHIAIYCLGRERHTVLKGSQTYHSGVALENPTGAVASPTVRSTDVDWSGKALCYFKTESSRSAVSPRHVSGFVEARDFLRKAATISKDVHVTADDSVRRIKRGQNPRESVRKPSCSNPFLITSQLDA